MEEIRQTGLGGTDIAAVLGMSPWRSPFDVFLDKTGQLEKGATNESRKRWGQRLQRVIADAYAEETGREVEWVDKTIHHASRPYQVWTPDALCTKEPRGLDCKTAALDQIRKWGDAGTDQVPDYVALQLHWYLSASEREYWDVALLIAGSDFRIYSLKRDAEVEGMLLQAGERFWKDHVVANKPPEITATDTTAEWLKKRFPKNDGAIRHATEEEIGLLLQYKTAQELFEVQEKRRDDVEMRVKTVIGDSDGLSFSGGYVSYKLVKGGHRNFDVPDHRRIYRGFKEGR
jgi:putative phage-type endonuclease